MTSSTAIAEVPSDPENCDVTISSKRRNLVFTAILLGMMLAALDQTIVATALPTVVADLGGAGHQSWVVTSYLLASTIVTAFVGKLGDLFGRKTVFQVATLCFVVGSALCGFAWSMDMLVASRALQGIGGGAVTVTAMALVGEIIPLRERGRYQGMLSANFAVTTVIGPLLGGFFTTQLSWRWAFWINIPVATVVLVVAGATIPALVRAAKPVIDYAGIVLIGLSAAGLTLVTSWGGTEYPWGSPTIIGLAAGSLAALAGFVWVETRAREPVLPPRLFRNSVFSVCCALAFTTGFAMLGAMTFMPTFMQFVDGASPITSGLHTLPMVVGMLATSTSVGFIVSRTGRYKIFPVVGMVLMSIGFVGLSRMGASSSLAYQSVCLFVLGVGIGLSMQVLTLVAQNSVRFTDLGVATSGVTFFRTIGSSFGAAIFGSLFNGFLGARIPGALAASGASPAAVQSPEALHQLPDQVAAPVIDAYAHSLDLVFLCVAPVTVVGFGLALLLREKPLLQTNPPGLDLGEGFGMPSSDSPEKQLEVAISWLLRNDSDIRLRHLAATKGVDVGVAGVWGLLRMYRSTQVLGAAKLSFIASRNQLPPEVLEPVFDQLVESADVVRSGDDLSLTRAGAAKVQLLSERQNEYFVEKLAKLKNFDGRPDMDQVEAALRRISQRWLVQRQWVWDSEQREATAELDKATERAVALMDR